MHMWNYILMEIQVVCTAVCSYIAAHNDTDGFKSVNHTCCNFHDTDDRLHHKSKLCLRSSSLTISFLKKYLVFKTWGCNFKEFLNHIFTIWCLLFFFLLNALALGNIWKLIINRSALQQT